MLSFWEQNSFQEYDVIIVGAGISGLSTAASLKEKDKSLKILVIERGTLPTGASTKNAGFACFGSVSELTEDRRTLGDPGMVDLVHRRWNGLQKTISRLGEERIGLIKKGGYELISDGQPIEQDPMQELNELLYPIFQDQVFSRKDEKLKDFGFGKTQALIFNQFEAQLNTGELIRSLWLYCGELGIQIITGTEVLGYNQLTHHAEVNTKNINFRARSVAFCTNAFTPDLLGSHLDITPGRGMVVLVKPKNPTNISGTFHYDEGYYYFRDFHGKLIFGGGRNLALTEENTSSFGINERIKAKLIQDLQQVILPNQDFRIEMEWSGIMAFGANKSPIVAKINDHFFVGARLGGMGVALGSMVGETLAEMILNSSN